MDCTKGSWIVKTQRAARYWKAEVRTPNIMDSEGKYAIESGQLIAVFYGKNTVANAHLSSAAPNMYAALENLIFQVSNNAVPYSQIRAAVIEGREALAKAKAEGKE